MKKFAASILCSSMSRLKTTTLVGESSLYEISPKLSFFELKNRKRNFSSTINNSTNDDWSNDGSIYNAEDVDRIQSIMKCCGSQNYTDFEESPWGKNHTDMAPESCCNVDLMQKNNMVRKALN